MPKMLSEWVLTMSKGDEVILTENQYGVYKERWMEGQIFFGELAVNPAYVVSAFKRPAQEIVRMYPCKDCNTNGHTQERDENGIFINCPNCEGTGVDLKR